MSELASPQRVVVLCDRPRAIRRLVGRLPGPVQLLMLARSDALEHTRAALRQAIDVLELSYRQLCREYEREFRTSYVDLLARLNEVHSGMPWTLMPFTSKSPLSTDVCRNAFFTLIIARVVIRAGGTLVVLTDSVSLARQVAAWGAESGVRVIASVRGRSPIRQWLKYRTPTAVLAAAFRTAVAAALARSMRPRSSAADPAVVVVTTMPQSSVCAGTYREAYFAPLVEYFARSRQQALVLALILSRSVATIRRLRGISPSVPVVPAEAWLTPRDVAACGWRSLRLWARPPRIDRPAVLGGIDMRPLLCAAVRESCRSSSFFKHLCVLAASRRLAGTWSVTSWIYPFENRAMERAMLLGVRQASARTVTVGWQNAALTPSHLNFLLGRSEAGTLPLPDLVFTTGVVVRDFLLEAGHFLPERVYAACALRQQNSFDAPRRPRPPRLRRALVVLASSIEEYIEVLTFVAEAFTGLNGIELRIRPHPEFPLASIGQAVPGLGFVKHDVSTGALEDDLRWTDVVLYASSTVSMEAVARGIPTIYIDAGHVMTTDPLFNRHDGLKWAACRPADLVTCLRAIESLLDEEYEQRAARDRQHVLTYLTPPDEDRIHTLLEIAKCPTSST